MIQMTLASPSSRCEMKMFGERLGREKCTRQTEATQQVATRCFRRVALVMMSVRS